MEAKTIEDRAYDFAMHEAKIEGFDFDSVENGYIQGATDQKTIDIDKACEWIKNNMAHFWHTDEDSIVSNFRKAMEDKN